MFHTNEWEMLKLPRRGIVAIEAMIHIALHGAGRVVPTAELSETIDVPKRSLEPVLLSLSKAGLLVSTRGPSGGYELGRDRRKISALAIVEAALESDKGDLDTRKSPYDVVSSVVEADAEQHLREKLSTMTLDALSELAKKRGRVSAGKSKIDYAI